MTLHGHVKNNAIIIDEDITLKDGTKVTIDIDEPKNKSASETILAFAKKNAYPVKDAVIPNREKRNAR